MALERNEPQTRGELDFEVQAALRMAAELTALRSPALDVRQLSLWQYGTAVFRDVTLVVPSHRITSVIGPVGCGSTALVRSMNRMNEIDPQARTRTEGSVFFHAQNIYGPDTDPIAIRRRIGMVFDGPNPIEGDIYDNVAVGVRDHREFGSLDDTVERALRQAALWDQLKDHLHESSHTLTHGLLQRLCIARALAVGPEILLMDQPCRRLDAMSTYQIEEVLHNLRDEYTIVFVTGNVQQAARISDYTAFMLADLPGAGQLVEFAPTRELFTRPADRRTEEYIEGRFG